jgi:hypothetical protein
LYEVSWGGEAVALPCQLNSEIRMWR